MNRIDHAERALRHFADSEIDRNGAARLLTWWSGRWMLSDADELELLTRFDSRKVSADAQ